jgi:HlyD family secretion protein
MKKIFICLLLIAAIASGVYYWQYKKTKPQDESPKPKLVKVERGAIVSVVDTTGKVVSNRDVEIKCKASGQVIKLPFEVSDAVKEGELLVELDPMDEQRAVQRADVTLAASKARLEQARQNLLVAQMRLAIAKKKTAADLRAAQARASDTSAKVKRLSDLLRSNLTSKEEYESSEANAIDAASALERAQISIEDLKADEMALELRQEDIKLAESQVKSNEIDLSQAQQRLSETKVYAPINGVVSVSTVQIGQIISSGISNVGGGTSMLTISDLSRIFVVASVDESDIGQVQEEQTALINTDAFPDRYFRGKVVLIATKGVSTANVVTFEVHIEVLSPNKSLLKPEMTANIKIVSAQKENTLLVPAEAVYLKSAERNLVAQVESFQNAEKSGNLSANTGDGRREGRGRKKRQDEQEDSKKLADAQPQQPNATAPKDDKDSQDSKKNSRKRGQYKPRKNFVLLMQDGKTEEREVEVGINDGTRTEILTGLAEGDEVAVEKGRSQSRWQNDMNVMRATRMMGGRGPR